MGNNYLLKSSLVFALLLVFCVKAMSQGPDNIPVEGSKFYQENGVTGNNKNFTRGDNDALWTFTSVVEHCFDKTKEGQKAWLMTADGETKLKVTFEYNTKDERYAIESADVSFYFYDGDDLFHDDNKQRIINADITGSFTKEVTEKTVTLHMKAPIAFPDPNISWYTFYVVLKLYFKGAGGASVARQIGVSRNGLFLLHGLNSSRECFFPFREYLLNTAQNYFVNQIYLGDYSSTNTSSFSDNTHVNRVVEKGLHQLCENLLKAGIASTKYDMMGHSMGGILERLYIQEIDQDHTNRLMTLNTPHFGSVLGNIYVEYDNYLKGNPGADLYYGVEKFNDILKKVFSKDHSMQAVKDLAKNSPAIKKLASKRSNIDGIPVCAVGSEINDWTFNMVAKESFYAVFPKLASALFDAKSGTGKAFLDKEAQKGSDYVPEYTFQLQECACGEGTLDIKLYVQLATAENPRMPMIIEHLTTDEEYLASVQYVRERLADL